MAFDYPPVYIEIESTPFIWWIELEQGSIIQLIDGADLKGSDLDVPHADGALPNIVHLAETTYTLPGTIFGDRDRDGDYTAGGRDEWIGGLEDHIAFLKDSICVDPGTADLRTLTLHWLSEVYTGEVRVARSLRLQEDDEWSSLCALRITIPAGELTKTGS